MNEWSMPPEWTKHAVCAQTDPEEFFPDEGGITRVAKAVCNGNPARGVEPCPVRAQCLAYAIDNCEAFGIWGGMSYRERQRAKEWNEAA